MKKILLLMFIILVMGVISCQQAVKKEITEKKMGVQEVVDAPKIEATGEAVIDSIGNDLNNVDSLEKDLGIDEISEIESGLEDIQNI